MLHQCSYCTYHTTVKYNLRRHIKNKHENKPNRAPTTLSVGQDGGRAPTTVSVPPQRMGVQYGNGFQAATSHQHASNPHPYVHPYLNNANQQHNTYPQRTPSMVGNNMYYAEETRAPTVMSVGPNGPRAHTTVSVPPHRSQHGTGIDETEESDSEEEENENALRYQHGTGIDEKEESDSEEEENENVSDINDILRDISKTFFYLQQLREQYRDALPQIRELEGEDMESFLECYANFKAYVLEEQEGLEGTVCAKKTQHGKDVDDTEDDETDEEAVDPGTDGSDADTEEGDTDEESMDTEVEDIVDDAEIEDIEFEFDKIEEEEICKEQFFDFVFEAENFLDSKSKDKLGKDLAEEKRYLKICNGFEQGLTDLPQAVDDVIEDLGDLIEEWNERDGKCFKTCSKRKIHSLSNVANTLVDSEILMKMKKINTPKYKFLRKMLKPHVKSVEKLADSNVSIHEKRKTLQKSQVGEGILQAAANLLIPYLEGAKKRKYEL
jgi:hypothetical protein